VTTYNPYFFGHSSPDFIPANPPAARVTPDLNRRDSALHPRETSAQWHAAKPRWSYSESTGLLESPFMMAEFDTREIERVVELASSRHGKDAVKSIVLFLTPECVGEQFHELRFHGFERAGHRENSKIPQLAFEGSGLKRQVKHSTHIPPCATPPR
jgi:hypothetical protein